MPELPEVESLRRTLEAPLVGRRIVSVRVGEPRLRRRVEASFKDLVVGRTIESLSRRGKYLIFNLSDGGAIIAHLGMSGTLTHRHVDFDNRALAPRHDHVNLELDDGSRLVLNDPRRFGLMKFVAAGEVEQADEIRALGPEPFSREFDAGYLMLKARSRKTAIKNLLMDQKVVAGVGNIYASEILFRAGVRPARRCGRLKRAEVELIAAITPEVLAEAIDGRGTTFRSYRDSHGRPGSFGEQLKVYGREGQPCAVCSTPIRKRTVGQRSSFYCPRCQQ